MLRRYAVIATALLSMLCACNGQEMAWYEPTFEADSGLTWSPCVFGGNPRCGLTYGEITLQIDPLCCEDFVRLVPFPVDIPTSDRNTFAIRMMFRPHNAAFTFDAQNVFIWQDSASHKLQPRWRIGPFSATAYSWDTTRYALPNSPIALPQAPPLAIWIIFDTPPPKSGKGFSMHITGLALNGQPYPLPVIHFREIRRERSLVMP
jgi:hypothetical protein